MTSNLLEDTSLRGLKKRKKNQKRKGPQKKERRRPKAKSSVGFLAVKTPRLSSRPPEPRSGRGAEAAAATTITPKSIVPESEVDRRDRKRGKKKKTRDPNRQTSARDRRQEVQPRASLQVPRLSAGPEVGRMDWPANYKKLLAATPAACCRKR